jgi:hypothetical protein
MRGLGNSTVVRVVRAMLSDQPRLFWSDGNENGFGKAVFTILTSEPQRWETGAYSASPERACVKL